MSRRRSPPRRYEPISDERLDALGACIRAMLSDITPMPRIEVCNVRELGIGVAIGSPHGRRVLVRWNVMPNDGPTWRVVESFLVGSNHSGRIADDAKAAELAVAVWKGDATPAGPGVIAPPS